MALIKRWEGFSARVYLCPAGRRTIGYGHVVRSGEGFPDGISLGEAEDLLISDIRETEQAVGRLVTVPLSQGQFDALVCLAYNIGAGALARSTLLRLLNAGNRAAAALEFSRWAYAGGYKLEGLIKRREEEKALFCQAIL